MQERVMLRDQLNVPHRTRRGLLRECAVHAPVWYGANMMLVMLGVYWLLDPLFLRLGMPALQPRLERIIVTFVTAIVLTMVARAQKAPIAERAA